ncbi:MAG: VanW family protein [Chthonomonadales bacterium]
MKLPVIIAVTSGALVIGVVSMFGKVASAPPVEVEMAGFATNLEGRSSSQRHNAHLAAVELNGAIIPAHGTFSFNKVVKSWSVDRGYVKAPVSYDGELIRAFGGGVCQASTTLYNVALLSGMKILERHPHVFAPHYIPPGRDAAVAHPSIDLRFKNPYSWPIRIKAVAKGDRLDVRFFGRHAPTMKYEVDTLLLTDSQPASKTRLISDEHSVGPTRSPGTGGCRVVAYRVRWDTKGSPIRERLSDNTYPAMNRIVRIREGD